MIWGYARKSRPTQNIERQIRNIKAAYPEAIIVQEAYTGTTMSRPEWNKLEKRLGAGDMVVFDSVSRMSRTAQEGVEVYKKLYDAGVALVFLKEPHINTSVFQEAAQRRINTVINTGSMATNNFTAAIIEAVNQLLIDLAQEQIRLAFDQAEKEVLDLRQRTREGIETARLNGKQIGHLKGSTYTTKKSVRAKEQIRKYSRAFQGTLVDKDCWKLIGITPNTYYKYKKEMLAEVAAGETTSCEDPSERAVEPPGRK